MAGDALPAWSTPTAFLTAISIASRRASLLVERMLGARPSFAFALALSLSASGRAATLVDSQHDGSNALSFVTCGGRVGFRTLEAQESHTDLNADGDVGDYVLQVLDFATGITTNSGADAFGGLACGGNLFAIGTDEFRQGDDDLDGDGDASHIVLQVFDASTGIVTNTGLPVDRMAASASVVAFSVPENKVGPGGSDLNGDNDTTDRILHVYDPDTHLVTNVGPAVGGDIVVDGTQVAFLGSEADQANAHLNADADASDMVLEIYDTVSAVVTNTARQARPGIQFSGGVVAFTVDEAANGGGSLNGDGDVTDKVVALYCTPSGTCPVPGLVDVGFEASTGFTLADGVLAFLTREAYQGFTDLNGDGDLIDTVVGVYRTADATYLDTGLAARPPVRVTGTHVVFAVSERMQDVTDLNGNFRTRDEVVHVFDVATGTPTNTGRAVWGKCPIESTALKPQGPCVAAGGDLVAMATNEPNQNRIDLNGDGDSKDAVAEIWRLSTGTLLSTGLAASRKSAVVVSGHVAAFRVSERNQANSSLNGDSDAHDDVIAAFDGSTDTAFALPGQAVPLFLVNDNAVVAKTIEKLDNHDLNGDGDLDDAIIQYSTF